jgi:DNA-binding transcriptional MerR regulator
VGKMRIPISKISKELNIKSFQLHKWEERGWLGNEPVLKDADNNGQRVYSEEQIKRIHFIHEVIEEQRKQGIKRTDFEEMEEKLLEKFGGEVSRIEKEEIAVLPASFDAFQKLFMQQNKQINALTEMVQELQKRELPIPVDHTSDFEEMKKQLAFSKEREDKLISLIENLQDDVELLQEKQKKKKSSWKFWE